MKQIAAAKFKQQCLAILDEVGEDGLLITKRGKPVAKLVRVERAPGEWIGAFRGKVRIQGDILGTGLRWDAEP